ncbi:hypothetical protein [Massilia glaciei]|uniref:Outer membrane protein beta-barrel domain-containing protein n=1 Tax=Massilia glaciei TaxID=1524097 RepID=A0A2U2HM21_9BURK|nr:hypothetical protein [Massilia glaciei]PWF48475.1 hypothetical protein C7C56_011610 [Massilia glaciei]
MKLQQICILAAAALGAPAFADDLENVQTLTQAEFARLSKDFTAAASYKGVTPAEPLGVVGFDLGVGLSSTKMAHGAIWEKAGGGGSSVYMTKVHIHKGLPFNVDVGASLAMVPGSDIKLGGAEIKYAFIEGGAAVPAVAVRAAATRLFGVDQLDLNTRSVELLVSKGFLNVTPYAGVGKVWGTLTPDFAGLTKEKPNSGKIFAGVNFSLGFGNLAAEFDSTGGNKSVSVKLGFRL